MHPVAALSTRRGGAALSQDAVMEAFESKDVVQEYKDKVAGLVKEYFASGDVREAADSLGELGEPLYQVCF